MYEEKKIINCTKRREGNSFVIICDIDGRKEEISCFVGQEGKSAGGSAFGIGGQYGYNNPTLVCFDDDDIKNVIFRKYHSKYGLKKEWINLK